MWFSRREPRNRGEGEGPGWRGLINFGPKSEASLWGRGGFINRRSPVVEEGGLFTGRFRAKNMKFSGPSSGPGTPPDVSGSLCCAFWWGLTPRELDSEPVLSHRCKMTPNSTNARRKIENVAFRAAGNGARIRKLHAESFRNQVSLLISVHKHAISRATPVGTPRRGAPTWTRVRPSRIQCTTETLSRTPYR